MDMLPIKWRLVLFGMEVVQINVIYTLSSPEGQVGAKLLNNVGSASLSSRILDGRGWN